MKASKAWNPSYDEIYCNYCDIKKWSRAGSESRNTAYASYIIFKKANQQLWIWICCHQVAAEQQLQALELEILRQAQLQVPSLQEFLVSIIRKITWSEDACTVFCTHVRYWSVRKAEIFGQGYCSKYSSIAGKETLAWQTFSVHGIDSFKWDGFFCQG